jgi:hypothetical protein
MPSFSRLTLLAAMLFTAATLPAHAADACSLLTTSQISAAMGTPAKDPIPGPKGCVWNTVNGKGTAYLTLPDVSAYDSFKATAQAVGEYVAVSGLGDDAFFVTDNLYVKKGSNVILLRAKISGNTLAQNQALEKTIAAQAIGKL